MVERMFNHSVNIDFSRLVKDIELFDFQKEGVKFLIEKRTAGKSVLLGDVMGLGKTLQSLAFYSHLVLEGEERPLLVVCPLSTLSSWLEHCSSFTPVLTHFCLFDSYTSK